MPYTCTICEAESTRICVCCTKDTCENHLCEKCQRCSDCCECEVPLLEETHPVAAAVHNPHPVPPVEPKPEPPQPSPDPDPVPEEDPDPGLARATYF